MKNKVMRPFRKFYGYLKKDIMLLYKRKKYLYIFLLLPFIISIIFLFALSPTRSEIQVGVCDYDETDISQEAFSDLGDFDPVFIDREDCTENLEEKIKEGKLPLGLVIEEGFSERLENLEQSRILVYYDNTDIAFTNLVYWKVDSSLDPYKVMIVDELNRELESKISSINTNFDLILEHTGFSRIIDSQAREIREDLEKLEKMETEFLVNPIYTEHRPIYSHDVAKDAGITFIFPILAIFIILMLASTSIIYDKKTNFITRVRASTSPGLYLLAKVLFFVLIALVQFAIVFLLFTIYGASYNFQILELLKLISVIGIINCLLGFIIGVISENEGIAILFSLIISFPLMLVSGIFFPIQTLPRIVQWIAQILPLHYQISASKSVLLFGQEISNYWFVVSLVLFGFVYWLVKKKI